MRLAVVDLGSNTFHLLIVDAAGTEFVEVYRQREFVGLGTGGLETILPDRITYGLQVVDKFTSEIRSYEVDKLVVTGTASLRFASNASDFVEPAERAFGTKIQVIEGDREAELIYKGVRLLTKDISNPYLVMDIGGGSTEFILCSGEEMLWSKSYKLGVGVLHAGYHHDDPIQEDDLGALRDFIDETVDELIAQCLPHFDLTLIGASGSFEVLEQMSGRAIAKDQLTDIDPEFFWAKSKEIIAANYEERLATPGIPEQRVKLIVVAMVLIQQIMTSVQPTSIKVSPFALKEGLLSEMNDLS